MPSSCWIALSKTSCTLDSSLRDDPLYVNVCSSMLRPQAKPVH
jgi:hypothetical protein